MSWTWQVLHDQIKQSAAIQAHQPTAWDWIDTFKQEKNAILLVFEVLRSCSDLDMFRLTVMLLKKIINGLISVLQNQDILAFIELLMNMTTKVIITDKPTLNNLCYIVAKLATRSDNNMIIMLFKHFIKSIDMAENSEFSKYYTTYLFNFLYESLTILDEKSYGAEKLHTQFKSFAPELLLFLEDNRVEHFNSAINCFKYGIKLQLFNISTDAIYSNKLFLLMFEVLLNPSLINIPDFASLPVNIEIVLNKLKRRVNISNYQFFNNFYANFLSLLQNGNHPIYSLYDGDDEFVLSVYYMTDSVVNIHREELSQLLLRCTNEFEPIPIIEATIYCIRKVSVTKLVSCLSIWRDLLYDCRLRVLSQKVDDWGALQFDRLISHYYLHYLKCCLSVVFELCNDNDNMKKGLYRMHQSFMSFFDRPPLKEEVISSFVIQNYINPNVINIPLNNSSTQFTVLSTKGFVGVMFMKENLRYVFLPVVKLVIDNQFYRLDNVYSNSPFLHMALVDLIDQSINFFITPKNYKYRIPPKPIDANADAFRLSTAHTMNYFLYLYGCCPQFSNSLYTKLIRCINRLFTLDPNSFQLYLPEFVKIINNAYNNTSNKRMTDVATDLLTQCVDFSCMNLADKCDINPILSSLFTPHIEIVSAAINRGKINKHALQFLKVAISALEIKFSRQFYMQLAEKVLPMFFVILAGNVNEQDIVESTCSCLRRMIREMGMYFMPYLDSLSLSIRKATEAGFHSTFLYITSVVVDELGHFTINDLHVASNINELVVFMFDISLSYIVRFDGESVNDIELQDHINESIEDFFVLNKRLLKACPIPFFNYPKVETICDVAVKYLTRKDSYAVSSIVSFWEVLISIATKSTDAIQKENAAKILVVYMPKIVFTIMSEMVHHPIYSIIDAYCDLLYSIKSCHPDLYFQSLTLTLTQIRNNDHIPAHIAIVEEISNESLKLNNRENLVDMCTRTLIKHT